MSQVFDHILVPVDFTAKNEAAIEVAKQIAAQQDSRISLLHVIETLDFPDDDEVQRFLKSMEEKSVRQMGDLRERYDEEGLELGTETIVNHRSRGIVEYAIENGVDLIVMSSHRIDPETRKSDWATISYQISLVCPCSIMLIKPQ